MLTEVLYYRAREGAIPLLEWFDELPNAAVLKCVAKLARLEQLGHEIRRPDADYLRDGIYELRAKYLGVNYRMLYFFHGRAAVVLSHGFSKQRARVAPKEIDLALKHKTEFEISPATHTFRPWS